MSISVIPIIDTDSHISEPPDLWTSRLSDAKWGDRVPHLEFDERRQTDRWVVGDRRLTGVAGWALAGWGDYQPSHPLTIEDAEPGAFYAKDRAKRLDDFGVTAQVLYPNLLAFFMGSFLRLKEPQLMLQCVQAYNDFLSDFSVEAPGRFIPLTVLPFWDVDASVAEIKRCAGRGHHGIVFASKPHKFELPELRDPHWAPILETAQELGLSINFHTGFQDRSEEELRQMISVGRDRADYAKESSLSLLGNAEAVADVIFSGLCHKYPSLNFVSVESGFGWLPYFVEAMDWQWLNSGAAKAHPERELPSFYFRRQIYGSFWFEREAVPHLLHLYPDNALFETDYPHPTSLSPGPASSAKVARQWIEEGLAGVPEELLRKVLFENAARLYHVEELIPLTR